MAIGKVQSQLREYEPAETAYLKAKETYANIGDPAGQIEALHAFAHLYYEMELGDARINVAREAWKMAKNLKDPETIRTAQVELAIALSECGFHSEAIQHMEATVAENPNNAWAVGCLGWASYQAGDMIAV